MNAVKNDPYISGYKYAKAKLLNLEKITIGEFLDYMKKQGFDNEQLNKRVFGSIVLPGYDQGNIGETQFYKQGFPESGDIEFDMLSVAYFNLAEMEELFEARRNAAEARWLSIGALALSLLAIITQLITSSR